MWGSVLWFAASSVAISGAIASGLIASQRPIATLPKGDLSFEGLDTDANTPKLPLIAVTARDGARLTAWHLPARDVSAPLLVMVHGSGWHGDQFRDFATALDGQAEVLAVNLRGHFNGPNPRGDLAYVGQLEDDLADMIAAHRKPGQKVILGGHSSGGGLVVRFVGGAHGHMADAAILLAPFLKYNAPTTRKNSGGWAHVLMRRIIGLSMLNTAKITAFDHLTVIQFAMPAAIIDGPRGQEATLSYSWRQNLSFAPRNDYLADVAKLPKFLLVAGTHDESFVADGYAPLMSDVTTQGRYHLLDGVTHLGVVNAAETAYLVREFLNEL